MAKILTTKGSAAAMEDLIRKAEKEIVLISFSFILSESFILKLKQAAERGVLITMVYGKSYKAKDEKAFASIPNLKIYSFRNLHAKIFTNENKCIIGSMNFSEASEIDNTELGVLLTSSTDAEAFNDAMMHVREILDAARSGKMKIENESAQVFKPKNVMPKAQFSKSIPFVKNNDFKSLKGNCIRCGTKIPHNTNKPFCIYCYEDWEEYSNEDYKEKFCHTCGSKTSGISMARPECRSCYSKY